MMILLKDMEVNNKLWLKQFNIDIKSAPDEYSELLKLSNNEARDTDITSEQDSTSSTQTTNDIDDEISTVIDLSESSDEFDEKSICGFKKSCCLM